MSRALSWIFAALATLLLLSLVEQDIHNLLQFDPGAIEDQQSASPKEEDELSRRTLVGELAEKLSLPVSSFSLGTMVGHREAQLRVNCNQAQGKRLESCIDDLNFPMRILGITSITLVDNDKEYKTIVVEPDMLGFSLSQDLVTYEVVSKTLPFLAKPVLEASVRHLERCLQAHPAEPALLGYESVLLRELGKSDDPTKEQLGKIAKLSDNSDRTTELAGKLESALTCTTSNTTAEKAEQLAEYLTSHLHDDLFRAYLLRNLYKDAGLADKAASAFKQGDEERKEVHHYLNVTVLLMIGSIAASVPFIFSKNKFFQLPSISSVACPVAYGWIKPWLILLAAFCIICAGYIAMYAIASFITQEAPSMMFSYFHPVQASAMVMVEESLLMLPFLIATYLFVGLSMPFSKFVKLRFSTEKYSTSELIKIGLQAFIISWIPAIVSMGLSLVFHHPPEKASSVATELLTSAGTVPSIALLWLGFGLIAPVTEEMVFRGLLHPALRRHWQMMPALILGSVLFAVVHMEFASWWLVEKFIFAAANIIALEKTDSILPGIINHILTNSMVLIILLASFMV